MKKKTEDSAKSLDFQRYVLAGFLVTLPDFVLKAEGSSEARLEELLSEYGIGLDLLKGATKPRLGFSKLEWQVLAAARTVILGRVIGPYDPPNCPDSERGKALMDAACKLNGTFKAKRPRPDKVKKSD
jgi:hypothetical protein